MVALLEPLLLEPLLLEPLEVLEAESIPKALPSVRDRWYYRMPCAGVKYYAFAPPKPPENKPPEKAVPHSLPLQLLDERVIVI